MNGEKQKEKQRRLVSQDGNYDAIDEWESEETTKVERTKSLGEEVFGPEEETCN